MSGDEIACGTSYEIKVYVYGAPSACSATAEGSISYLCTSCYQPH